MGYDGKLIIGTEIDNRKFDKQIDQLDKQAQDLERKIEKDKKLQIDTSSAEASLEKIKNKIETLNNQSLRVGLKNVSNIEFNPTSIRNLSNAKVQFQGLNGSVSKLKGELPYVASNLNDIAINEENVGNEAEKASRKTTNGFSKGITTLKRFGLALFGIHSIYRLVSRASSSYLSQNTELADKLQSVWVGLGSFLAPVLEMITDALSKAVGYLNVFIKALTGQDFIARANAKAIQSQAKATSNLNKAMKENQQYNFDVIRTQQSQTTGGTASGGGGANVPLFEVPELDEGIVKKLQDLAKWLKENWYWIKEVGKVLLITFGAAKIAKVLSGISTLMGSAAAGTGLLGLAKLLGIIGAVIIITLAVKGLVEVKQQLDELRKMQEKNIDAEKDLTKQTKSLSDQYWDLVDSGKVTTEQTQMYTNYLDRNSQSIKTQIKDLQDQKTWYGNVTGSNKRLTEQQKELAKQLEIESENFYKLYKAGKITDDQAKNYIDTLLETQQELGEAGIEVDGLRNNLLKIAQKYNTTVNVDDQASWKIQNILNNLQRLYNVTLRISSSGGIHGGGGRAFAVGGIVTQPTRALIGEAGYPEAVVPMTADYLSTLASEISKYGGSSKGNVVNVYLDGRLIQRQISNKEEQIKFATNNR